jgi:hypothetical protein
MKFTRAASSTASRAKSNFLSVRWGMENRDVLGLMQHSGLLYWWRRSVLCRWTIIGGLVGAFVSLGIIPLEIATGPHKPMDVFMALWVLIFTVPDICLRALGVQMPIWSSQTVTIISMILVNILLSSLIGTMLGLLIKAARLRH